MSIAFGILRARGWVTLGLDSREVPTLTVAREFGDPIRGPTDDLVRRLVPKNAQDALAGTLSHKYGRCNFPLHTDTAFWPVPARYLVFRVTGDTRRPTIIAPVRLPNSANAASDILSSVWIVKHGVPFYCSMQFKQNNEAGFRYDPMTMLPVNTAAKRVSNTFPAEINGLPTVSIDWAAVGTLIVDNWRVLHGRGAEPPEEDTRVLERIYLS